jgi:hypothetical protein
LAASQNVTVGLARGALKIVHFGVIALGSYEMKQLVAALAFLVWFGLVPVPAKLACYVREEPNDR